MPGAPLPVPIFFHLVDGCHHLPVEAPYDNVHRTLKTIGRYMGVGTRTTTANLASARTLELG